MVKRHSENVGKVHELGRVIKFSATETQLILNVDKEKLKAAPGVENGTMRPAIRILTIFDVEIILYIPLHPPFKGGLSLWSSPF